MREASELLLQLEPHVSEEDINDLIKLLEKMKGQFGYEMIEISKETLEDMDISSSQIRQSLLNGDIKLANELLGHNYSISGTVVKGLQNGRKMGYPTANIQLHDEFKLVPKTGIYAVLVHDKERSYQGMLSIGFNPTFNGKTQTIEVHILDFDKDIYGETLSVEFIEYLRGEQKFNSADELVAEIKRDEAKTRAILTALNNQVVS